MNPDLEFGRFFLPGPTEVRPEVLSAMLRPVIGHRGDAMRELLERIEPGLQELFGTRRSVMVSTSSATGLMETAITNLSNRRVLALVCGAFGDRFRAIAEICGRSVDVLAVEPGEPNLPEKLESALKEELGCILEPSPFFQLAVVPLPNIPELGLTDKGLFDVRKYQPTEVIIK